MDITIDFLKSLSAEDLCKIKQYQVLLADAENAVKAVVARHKFSLFQDKIVLYNDGNNAEYLTRDGVWQARYLHQKYDVKITVEDIFDVYKEEHEHKLLNTNTVNNKADSAGYFRNFVKRCKTE